MLAGLLVALIPVTPAAAQEPFELPQPLLDQFGVTVDDVLAAEPNRSWDGLGLFSDDALRVLTVAGQPTDVTPYAFGDDPTGTPVIEPTGANPVETGAMLWTIPSGWTPPAHGLTDTMAFAQTELSQLAGGDDVMLFWVRFDSDYDFTSDLTINEGFPLTIPGLPVWESTFAGDTWEGANVIPNAWFDNETDVLRLDVWQWNGQHPFDAIDLPSFYYRSGDIMAIAVSAPGLATLLEQAQPASTDTAGATSNLLYRGDSHDRLTQAVSYEALQGLIWAAFSHLTRGAQFTPGFIFRTVAGGIIATLLVLLAGNLLIAAPPPPEPEPEPTPDEGDAATAPDPPSDADDPDSAVAGTDDTESEATTTSTTTDDGSGLGAVFFAGAALLLLAFLFALWKWAANRPTPPPPDDDELTDYAAKLSGVVTDSNEATFFFHRGDKTRTGRNATATRPPETAWNQKGPSPIYKVEDQQIIGSDQVIAPRYSSIGGGFRLASETERPQSSVHLDPNHFLSTGDVDHDIKFGFEYRGSSACDAIAPDPATPFDGSSAVCLWESNGPPVVGVVGPPGFCDAGGRVIARWCGPLDERGVAQCGLDEIDLSTLECDQTIDDDVEFSGSPTRSRQGADVLFIPVGDGAPVIDIRMAFAPDVGAVNTELAVDVFNVFNSDLVLEERRVVSASAFGPPVEVLGPRLIRFGAKVSF